MDDWGHEEVRDFPGVQETLNVVLDTEIVYIDGACGYFYIGSAYLFKKEPLGRENLGYVRQIQKREWLLLSVQKIEPQPST